MRIAAIVLAIVLLCGVSACGADITDPDAVNNQSAQPQDIYVAADTEQVEVSEEYGSVTCEVYYYDLAPRWESAGTLTISLDTYSEVFNNGNSLSQSEAMQQVNLAIGKVAGESFTLWFSDESGWYGYRYDIKEVRGTNPKIIEYNDRVTASYSERINGIMEDDLTYRVPETSRGQVTFRATYNDFFIAESDINCSFVEAYSRLKDVLGLHTRDRFKHRLYTTDTPIIRKRLQIKSIEKAAKYGDTIVADVSKVFVAANAFENIAATVYDNAAVGRSSSNGLRLCFNGVELSVRHSQMLFGLINGSDSQKVFMSDEGLVLCRLRDNGVTFTGEIADNSTIAGIIMSTSPDNTYYCDDAIYDYVIATDPDAHNYYVYDDATGERAVYRIVKEYLEDGSLASESLYRSGELVEVRHYDAGVLYSLERFGYDFESTEVYKYNWRGVLVSSEYSYKSDYADTTESRRFDKWGFEADEWDREKY